MIIRLSHQNHEDLYCFESLWLLKSTLFMSRIDLSGLTARLASVVL